MGSVPCFSSISTCLLQSALCVLVGRRKGFRHTCSVIVCYNYCNLCEQNRGLRAGQTGESREIAFWVVWADRWKDSIHAARGNFNGVLAYGGEESRGQGEGIHWVRRMNGRRESPRGDRWHAAAAPRPRPRRAAACCRPSALAKVCKRPNFYYEINITRLNMRNHSNKLLSSYGIRYMFCN